MDDLDFINALNVAQDDRLRSLRATSVFAQDVLRRGPKEEAPQEAIGDDLRAAVNAGSIISFVSGVTAAQKSDVLFSTQIAQRAASAKHDRHEAIDEWYRVYVEVLERLGWVGEGFAFSDRASASGEFRMDKSALNVIAAIATGNQLAILVKALDTLKAMAEDDGAIRVFEMQAVAELSGNYQLGAVQKSKNDALSLALGAFCFQTTDRRRRVLFWRWGSEEIRFWAAAQKMTLNEQHYAPLRAAVIAKLGAEAADYIVDLDVI